MGTTECVALRVDSCGVRCQRMKDQRPPCLVPRPVGVTDSSIACHILSEDVS